MLGFKYKYARVSTTDKKDVCNFFLLLFTTYILHLSTLFQVLVITLFSLKNSYSLIGFA